MVLCLVAVGCAGADAPVRGPEKGEPAPDYSAVTLDGDTVSLGDYRGRAVLLNVWATWCQPCIAEFPDLRALQDSLGPKGLTILGVSVDETKPREMLEEFTARHGITWPTLRDRQARVANTFGWAGGIPKSVLIDREGRVVAWWSGVIDPSSPKTAARFERALRDSELSATRQ